MRLVSGKTGLEDVGKIERIKAAVSQYCRGYV